MDAGNTMVVFKSCCEYYESNWKCIIKYPLANSCIVFNPDYLSDRITLGSVGTNLYGDKKNKPQSCYLTDMLIKQGS